MTQRIIKKHSLNDFKKGRVNPSEKIGLIQGLYPVKNSCQSFWTLKAKIELAIFQEKKRGEQTK